MGRRELENKIYEALEPAVSREGVKLLDIELTSEGKSPVLRVVIYKPEGISLDDCARVDRAVGPILDEMDPIPTSYNLEVSSPGLERTLRRDVEFDIFSGKLCRVTLFSPYNGLRSYVGILAGLGQDENGQDAVLLDLVDDKEKGTSAKRIALNRKHVSKVQLVYSDKLEKEDSGMSERRRE